MDRIIYIDEDSDEPKYLQMVNSIIKAVEECRLKRGDQLPSINVICGSFNIGRATVTKAYDELQSRGIIAPRHGKGFYIESTIINTKLKVFVLFNEINAYKEVLYNSLVKGLGNDAAIHIFFYHHDLEIFKTLLKEHIGKYNFYVIMPHFDQDIGEFLRMIPKRQILILDKSVPSLLHECPCVYQDFERDIYQSLKSGLPLLKKYNAIRLVLSKKSFQYVPLGIIFGFKKFCFDHNFGYEVYDDLETDLIRKNEAFIVFTDADMIQLIKHAKTLQLKLGLEIGLISYDETPVKEILEGGITVITTDFKAMGETAACMIREKQQLTIANPSKLIVRRSL